MNYKDYEKLNRAEKRAFKKSGGKIEYSFGRKVIHAVLWVSIMVVFFNYMQDEKPVEKSQPWDTAEAACLTQANALTDSALNLNIYSNKDWGDDGYVITVRIKVTDAMLDAGIVCWAKSDGTVKKVEPTVLRKWRS